MFLPCLFIYGYQNPSRYSCLKSSYTFLCLSLETLKCSKHTCSPGRVGHVLPSVALCVNFPCNYVDLLTVPDGYRVSRQTETLCYRLAGLLEERGASGRSPHVCLSSSRRHLAFPQARGDLPAEWSVLRVEECLVSIVFRVIEISSCAKAMLFQTEQ